MSNAGAIRRRRGDDGRRVGPFPSTQPRAEARFQANWMMFVPWAPELQSKCARQDVCTNQRADMRPAGGGDDKEETADSARDHSLCTTPPRPEGAGTLIFLPDG